MKLLQSRLLLQLAPIIFFIAVMIGLSVHTPMWMDEYVFYKLASNFPDYSSSSSWFFEDRPEMLTPTIDWGDVDKKAWFSAVYDTDIYPHTPLTVMLASPAVKGLNYLADKGIINHIEDEPGYVGTSEEDMKKNRAENITNILRIVPMALTALSMWLIFKLLYHKVGTSAYLFAMPIAGSIMTLLGLYLFYWDVFMMFFLVLTLYLMEVKPNSKWKYVTACCLVNTKMFIGIVYLAPLVVKAIKDNWRTSWKMMLPTLSILPFYIATVVVTGEPLYVFTHYLNQIPIHQFMYTLNTPFEYLMILINLGMPYYLLMTVPLLWFWKKYPGYVLLWATSFTYAWSTGLGITHASAMTYTGALAWPLAAHELRVIDRVRSWLKSRRKVVV